MATKATGASAPKKTDFKQRVPVKLRASFDDDDGMEFVSVNGYPVNIKKGYSVQIPLSHKRVLERRERAREEAMRRRDAMTMIDLTDNHQQIPH